MNQSMNTEITKIIMDILWVYYGYFLGILRIYYGYITDIFWVELFIAYIYIGSVIASNIPGSFCLAMKGSEPRIDVACFRVAPAPSNRFNRTYEEG